jgi:hypothetical protein
MVTGKDARLKFFKENLRFYSCTTTGANREGKKPGSAISFRRVSSFKEDCFGGDTDKINRPRVAIMICSGMPREGKKSDG